MERRKRIKSRKRYHWHPKEGIYTFEKSISRGFHEGGRRRRCGWEEVKSSPYLRVLQRNYGFDLPVFNALL
jgi:hypothetical protein